MNILLKIRDKGLHIIFKTLGRDSITFEKIISRPDIKTLGSTYGGWAIPTKLFNQHSICYCAGCGEDISFDLALIERYQCNIYGIDPTPKAIKYVKKHTKQNSFYHLIEKGLWDTEDKLRFYEPVNSEHVSHSLVNLQSTENYIDVDVVTLSTIMSKYNHEKIDLLKIDIEGAEYKVISTIVNEKLNITVLCIEFDELYNPLDSTYRKRIKSSLKNLLLLGYEIVAIQDRGNYTLIKKSAP